jgi:hypothetical protein
MVMMVMMVMVMLTGSLEGVRADVYGVLIKSWISAFSSTGIYLSGFHEAAREVVLLPSLPSLPICTEYFVWRTLLRNLPGIAWLDGWMVLQTFYR